MEVVALIYDTSLGSLMNDIFKLSFVVCHLDTWKIKDFVCYK